MARHNQPSRSWLTEHGWSMSPECNNGIGGYSIQIQQDVRVVTQYASAPCKLTISSHLFARWHLFRHVGYLRHQQQVDLWPCTSCTSPYWSTSYGLRPYLCADDMQTPGLSFSSSLPCLPVLMTSQTGCDQPRLARAATAWHQFSELVQFLDGAG